jgi:hypothetical protein
MTAVFMPTVSQATIAVFMQPVRWVTTVAITSAANPATITAEPGED